MRHHYAVILAVTLCIPHRDSLLADERPNILCILADDLGFSDLGCYGSEIATPNLDSLGASGLKYTQFYNTARCWPTRAALLTGYYPQQIRRDAIPGPDSRINRPTNRPDWAVLLPEMLRTAGYRSYHTGKWHIDGMPIAEGFDRSYYLKDQGRFFNPTKHWKDDKPLPAVRRGTDFYATTALADHAVEVLREHASEHSDQPFFHYLAFAAPHFPLQAPPEDIEIYKDTYASGWDRIRQQRYRRQRDLGLFDDASVGFPSRPETDLGPPYHFPEAFSVLGSEEINKPLRWDTLTVSQQEFQAKKMAIHAAMIHRMDLEIGRVFAQIREMGEWEDTLIIFLSDNGASAEIMVRDDGHDPSLPPGSAGTYLCLGPGWSTTCNTPFRRHKTWTHEGGISTPLLISWPKGIPAAGETRRSMGHVVDIVPTILELTDGQMREGSPAAPGQSLVATFSSDQSIEHPPIWWCHDGHRAIRSGKWKAVSAKGEPWELFDLSSDRQESEDRAVPASDVLKRLVATWTERRSTYHTIASADLPEPDEKEATSAKSGRGRQKMNIAQENARPKRKQVLINGTSFLLNGRHAFLMDARNEQQITDKPWIFYAPCLNGTPDRAESWMHRKLLNAGVSIAGIDVGEAYGSPHAFPHFEALYEHMIANGFSKKPSLLGRSRGGLWVSSWAIAHPERVSAIGGIYPVFSYTSYPGVQRAASAYNVTPEVLLERQDEFNPINSADVLAKANIPVFIIHGTIDKVVPLKDNTELLQQAYRKNGVGDLIKVIRVEGQGHNFWEGFFRCEPLINFMIESQQTPTSSAR